jgi:hypothetical protein
MWVSSGATATLVGCSFSNNSNFNTTYNSAVLSVNAVNPNVAYSQLQDTIVRLQNCSFPVLNSSVVSHQDSDLFPAYSARVYSDNATLEVLQVSRNGEDINLGSAEPLSAAPAGRKGIAGTSTWLQEAQQV